ncbi:hypothetical protein BGW39_007918 [Mortierella sp. 14UC]|nr:hypothetical protein BGW39_007918 [Mortierella sp. 14UC]
MSGDINAALSKVTPEKSAFLVDAWRAYEGIPDVPTFKFIGALMDLEFEIVRYWFYCRSNRDGIKRAYAQSAAGGSTEGIVLPALEDYHLLDKFSEDMDWDYQVPGDETQEQEQEEPTFTSPTPVAQHIQSTLPQQHRRKLSNAASPSSTSKARTTVDLSQPSRIIGTRRGKVPRRLSKSTQESAEENELGSNDSGSEPEETGTPGSRGMGSSRTCVGPSKAPRPLKRVAQQSDGEPLKKRGRPLGSFKKNKIRNEDEVDLPPPRTNAKRSKQQQPPPILSLPPPPPTAMHLPRTDSPRTNTPTRYLTPIILIPRVTPRTPVVTESTSDTPPAPTEPEREPEPEPEPELESEPTALKLDKTPEDDSPAVQKIDQGNINSSHSREPAISASSAPTPGLVGDPVAGAESRKRFLEQQQSAEERERRARNRAQSKAPVKAPAKARIATASTEVATRAKSRRRKVIHQSDEEDQNCSNDDEDENGNKEAGGGFASQTPNHLNNSGTSEIKKAEGIKAPLSILPGSTHSFYKEFASLKPKRREKQPAQGQLPGAMISVEVPPASKLSHGSAPQLSRSPTNQTISHPLSLKTTASTIPLQIQFGDSGVQYSYGHPASDSAEHVKPSALLELEKIASRQRDEERRRQEAEKYLVYSDDPRWKECGNLSDIDMAQVPTGPAADVFNGITGGLQKHDYSTDANVHPHQPSPTEVYSPQVITMEISRPSPPLSFLPPLSSDQRLHSPNFVPQHSNFGSLDHDTTQRDHFHALRPESLSRIASGRSIRQQRAGEDTRDRRSSTASSPSIRNKSQHHDNRSHRQEELQGSHGDRGYRGSSGQQSSYNSHHSHPSHYDNRRDDHVKRVSGDNHRHSHRNHRNGDGDRHREYEVDTFRRSTNGSRGSKERFSRRQSRMGRSSSNSVSVGNRYERDRSSRRPGASRDRRGDRDGHSYHDSTPRDEEELEGHLQSKWVDKREQDRKLE